MCSSVLTIKRSSTSNLVRHVRLKYPTINLSETRLQEENEASGAEIEPPNKRVQCSYQGEDAACGECEDDFETKADQPNFIL